MKWIGSVGSGPLARPHSQPPECGVNPQLYGVPPAVGGHAGGAQGHQQCVCSCAKAQPGSDNMIVVRKGQQEVMLDSQQVLVCSQEGALLFWALLAELKKTRGSGPLLVTAQSIYVHPAVTNLRFLDHMDAYVLTNSEYCNAATPVGTPPPKFRHQCGIEVI